MADLIHGTVILCPRKAGVPDTPNGNQGILCITCVNYSNQFTVGFVSF